MLENAAFADPIVLVGYLCYVVLMLHELKVYVLCVFLFCFNGVWSARCNWPLHHTSSQNFERFFDGDVLAESIVVLHSKHVRVEV
jgi:hypothetical protein